MKQIFKQVKNFIFEKQIRFGYLSTLGFYNWIPDDIYLKKEFKVRMGNELNLNNPQTFNEKIQWLKLYDRHPEYTMMVDKYAAKQYVASKIGDDYIIPTLGVWTKFDDIDFDKLPNQFVLKCTHDSGGLVICKDKSTLDITAAKRKIEHCLKRKYYYIHREWPYKNVKPRIIAEKFMVDESGELRDYKFYCFNGEPKVFLVASERFSGHRTYFDYFDMEGNHLPFTQGGMNNPVTPELPSTFEEMKQVAMKLSHGLPHVRIDLYSVDGKVFFGEFTFFDSSGFEKFTPREWDNVFGNWLNLPTTSKERA